MFKAPEVNRRCRILTGTLLAGAVFSIVGCASAPTVAPTSLVQAERAIGVAESEDANHYAAAELDEARQKLLSAEKAFAAENVILADRAAQQSTLTAELATARTEAARAAAINNELNRGVEALTEEMQRAGEQQ